MKKNDLIKKLKQIKGNPDIVVWNGFVQDFNHIGGIEPTFLYRECREHLITAMKYEIWQYNKELSNEQLLERVDMKLVDEDMSNREWEFPNSMFDERLMKSVYGDEKKAIIMIVPKKRDKSTCDRLGTMRY